MNTTPMSERRRTFSLEYLVRQSGMFVYIDVRKFTIHIGQGLVVMPSFVSSSDQRDLVRVSLQDHARHPNETNLDTHYVLPPEGLWNVYLEVRENQGDSALIEPRASLAADDSAHLTAEPGPRKLISNEAASKENYTVIASIPMLPRACWPARRNSRATRTGSTCYPTGWPS